MNRKVVLISIDGMRPDGLLQCGNPFVEELMKNTIYVESFNGYVLFTAGATIEGSHICTLEVRGY